MWALARCYESLVRWMVALLSIGVVVLLATPVYAADGAVAVRSSQTVQGKTSSQSIRVVAKQVQKYLANGQYHRISEYIHPTRGVRFSMYAYVDPAKDKLFSRSDFETYLEKSRVRFTWGSYDGSGEPFVETLPKYLKEWVRAESFNHRNTVMSVNQFRAGGNSLNNLLEAYPKHDFVEFYYKGSQSKDFFDWRALRLVFDTYEGKTYLVAIISDEWTI